MLLEVLGDDAAGIGNRGDFVSFVGRYVESAGSACLRASNCPAGGLTPQPQTLLDSHHEARSLAGRASLRLVPEPARRLTFCAGAGKDGPDCCPRQPGVT